MVRGRAYATLFRQTQHQAFHIPLLLFSSWLKLDNTTVVVKADFRQNLRQDKVGEGGVVECGVVECHCHGSGVMEGATVMRGYLSRVATGAKMSG